MDYTGVALDFWYLKIDNGVVGLYLFFIVLGIMLDLPRGLL